MSNGSLGATFPLPPLDSQTHKFWLWETEYHVVDDDSMHIQPSGETCPGPARYCHLANAITESSKSYPIFLSVQLLLDEEEHVKPVNSMSMSPVPYFFVRQMCSLVKSNSVWNTRAFCEFMEGSFSRSIVCGGRQISTYPKTAFFIIVAVQYNHSATGCRVMQRDSAVLEIQS